MSERSHCHFSAQPQGTESGGRTCRRNGGGFLGQGEPWLARPLEDATSSFLCVFLAVPFSSLLYLLALPLSGLS